jgi:3-hydroxy-D-aspartate aldolase
MEKPPASVGMHVSDVDTPALIFDLDAFGRNIDKLTTASSSSVALRPHAKTHKTPAVALRQMDRGAVGVCCQKVGEAEVMVEGGIKNILLTNEVWGASKLQRLASLGRYATVAVCVDDEQNIRDLNAAAGDAGSTLGVLIEINVSGNLQCGVDPGDPAVQLARLVSSQPHLQFKGLQAYNGPAQHKRTVAERKEAISSASEKAGATRDLLIREGFSCDIISGGGTGTYALEAASGVYTELQAGSYAFFDADYARNIGDDGGPYADFEQSLFVYGTVMSRPTRDSGILDAGIKASSVDSGPPLMYGHEAVTWAGGGDEHAKFTSSEGAFPYALGDKVRLVPGHIDPTVNLHDWLVGYRGERVEVVWPVLARGMGR